MEKLKNFFNITAIIPWPILVAHYQNSILTGILLGFQLFCLFAGIYLDKKYED